MVVQETIDDLTQRGLSRESLANAITIALQGLWCSAQHVIPFNIFIFAILGNRETRRWWIPQQRAPGSSEAARRAELVQHELEVVRRGKIHIGIRWRRGFEAYVLLVLEMKEWKGVVVEVRGPAFHFRMDGLEVSIERDLWAFSISRSMASSSSLPPTPPTFSTARGHHGKGGKGLSEERRASSEILKRNNETKAKLLRWDSADEFQKSPPSRSQGMMGRSIFAEAMDEIENLREKKSTMRKSSMSSLLQTNAGGGGGGHEDATFHHLDDLVSVSSNDADEEEESDNDHDGEEEEDGRWMKRKRSPALAKKETFGSMEEFFANNNQHPTVKHELVESYHHHERKSRLRKFDSGEFYSAPPEYRKYIVTQGKEELRKALDAASETHTTTTDMGRPRRSSLSFSSSSWMAAAHPPHGYLAGEEKEHNNHEDGNL